MNIEDRVKAACDAHSSGYNCVQSVLTGYIDIFNVDYKELMTMSMGLGRGIGSSYEICGTALGGAMVISRRFGQGESDVKMKHAVEKKINSFIQEFNETYGAVTCGELLGIRKTGKDIRKKNCHVMVEEVVRMLEKYVSEDAQLN